MITCPCYHWRKWEGHLHSRQCRWGTPWARRSCWSDDSSTGNWILVSDTTSPNLAWARGNCLLEVLPSIISWSGKKMETCYSFTISGWTDYGWNSHVAYRKKMKKLARANLDFKTKGKNNGCYLETNLSWNSLQASQNILTDFPIRYAICNFRWATCCLKYLKSYHLSLAVHYYCEFTKKD